MKPCLQLYAIVLEQLDGYKLPQNYWQLEEQKLRREGRPEKYIKSKIQAQPAAGGD
jgi:hypothetical protein